MESNVNPGWEPEEKNISSMPADEQQTEDTDNTVPEEEDDMEEDDNMEEESLEDEESEEEPVEEGSADIELDTEEEFPDTAHSSTA